MADEAIVAYKTINVFIERDYLETVLLNTIKGAAKLKKEEQIDFIKFFKKNVNVLGFRDPTRAPMQLRVNAFASAFEEKDDVIPFTLSTWAEVNKKLAKKVKKWLEEEGWKDLALERTFVEGEGFLVKWPKKLTFDKLVKKYQKTNPDEKFERDDLILMVLWISGQLPKDQSDI
jgi:hypothetical protein